MASYLSYLSGELGGILLHSIYGVRMLRTLCQHTLLVPNCPLSYSLQSRSSESVSYTDAPAVPLILGLIHSDKFIFYLLIENAADAVFSTPHSCLTTPCPTHCSPAHTNVSYTDAPAHT